VVFFMKANFIEERACGTSQTRATGCLALPKARAAEAKDEQPAALLPLAFQAAGRTGERQRAR
jgi:hypothetical protein